MKDLLKKKGNKPAKTASPKAKKPLFAKKTKSPTQPKVKKPLFGKKDKAAKPAKTVAMPKTDGLDTKKIVFILIALLVLVLAVLAARLFLFNNEPVSETVYTPATTEEMAADQEAEPLETTIVDVDTAESTDDSVEPQVEVESVDTVAMQNDNTAVVTDSQTDSTSQPMTLEEFKQEAATRVYRERNTAPQSQ